MKVQSTKIPGLNVVRTSFHEDSRGAFMRCFCDRELASVLQGRMIVQINHSRTNEVGAIRGLHYQRPPFSEMKLVRCIAGRVWDVAVDVRRGSPTFLHWHAEELSPKNATMFAIPEGFAHGFQVLEPHSEMLYLHTQYYDASSEGGIGFNDPKLAIEWPLEPTEVSMKDRSHSFLDSTFDGI